MAIKTISKEALEVLERGTCVVVGDKHHYKLPPGQLDRALYTEVNEALVRLGGKWTSGKVAAHVFSEDPSQAISDMLGKGVMAAKNPTAFFATPPEVAKALFRLAGFPESIRDNARVLEPSAGEGDLADVFKAFMAGHGRTDFSIDVCEILPKNQEVLKRKGYNLLYDDFLNAFFVPHYDVVIMNPPFAVAGDPTAWLTHVEHAYNMLDMGGILCAVVPAGFAFRADMRAFKARVEKYGQWEELPAKAFSSSGTGVNTCILVMQSLYRSDAVPQTQLL